MASDKGQDGSNDEPESSDENTASNVTELFPELFEDVADPTLEESLEANIAAFGEDDLAPEFDAVETMVDDDDGWSSVTSLAGVTTADVEPDHDEDGPDTADNPLVDETHPEETVTLGAEVVVESAQVIEPTEPVDLEMRQIAGLTAGSMMKLSLGRAFEFNESNEGGSFSLRVMEDGNVVVHPGSAKAIIDEIEVTEPTVIGDAILNVSSACFSVRPPRPEVGTEPRLKTINATFFSAAAITVPPLGAEEPLPPEQLAGSRLGALVNRNPLTRGAIGQEAWDFLQNIRDVRAAVAERHRLVHPDPEELKTRLSRLDPGLWGAGRRPPAVRPVQCRLRHHPLGAPLRQS